MSYTPLDGRARATGDALEKQSWQFRPVNGLDATIHWGSLQDSPLAPQTISPTVRDLLPIVHLIESSEKTALSSAADSISRQLNMPGDSPATNSEAQKSQPHLPDLPILEKFLGPDCKIRHVFLADGDSKTIQTAPDGSTRTQIRFADGRKEATIANKYGRPMLTQEVQADGSWTITELNYRDQASGKLSPFVASKRITSSASGIKEIIYNSFGKAIEERQVAL